MRLWIPLVVLISILHTAYACICPAIFIAPEEKYCANDYMITARFRRGPITRTIGGETTHFYIIRVLRRHKGPEDLMGRRRIFLDYDLDHCPTPNLVRGRRYLLAGSIDDEGRPHFGGCNDILEGYRLSPPYRTLRNNPPKCPATNTGCPPGVSMVNCFADPCQVSTCPEHPGATCESNYCGGCNANWYDSNGNLVSCNVE